MEMAHSRSTAAEIVSPSYIHMPTGPRRASRQSIRGRSLVIRIGPCLAIVAQTPSAHYVHLASMARAKYTIMIAHMGEPRDIQRGRSRVEAPWQGRAQRRCVSRRLQGRAPEMARAVNLERCHPFAELAPNVQIGVRPLPVLPRPKYVLGYSPKCTHGAILPDGVIAMAIPPNDFRTVECEMRHFPGITPADGVRAPPLSYA